MSKTDKVVDERKIYSLEDIELLTSVEDSRNQAMADMIKTAEGIQKKLETPTEVAKSKRIEKHAEIVAKRFMSRPQFEQYKKDMEEYNDMLKVLSDNPYK